MTSATKKRQSKRKNRQKPKRRWGDRGTLPGKRNRRYARPMPFVLPNRADNEAVLNEVLDI